MTRRNTARRSAPVRKAPATAGAHLLSDSELRRVAGRVFKLSDADETEVHLDVTSDALTRFANNAIHQNVAEQSLTIAVRTVLDGRTARATTNKTDEESLRRVIAASCALARSQPKNPHLLPMPGPQKYSRVQRCFEATADATPADRARAV
ncbi:MAG TPA: DNA gyrase modulator, partial [Candidatus Acidoferrales bacterium]|nr:DNA gyrase modulator [Candidatus Acidoferrales bacterium]